VKKEDEIIDGDIYLQPSNYQSITGDNIFGTIHTSQEVLDPFGHTILSPKREKFD
jgi:hypothetical protein